MLLLTSIFLLFVKVYSSTFVFTKTLDQHFYTPLLVWRGFSLVWSGPGMDKQNYFGLKEGGKIVLDLKYSEFTYKSYITILTKDQWDTARLYQWRLDHCFYPAHARYHANWTIQTQFTAPKTDRYYISFLNCGTCDNECRVTGEISFINPDNKHLSIDLIPMIDVSIFFSVLYLFTFIIWIKILYKHWTKSLLKPTHYFITASLFLFFISTSFQSLYFTQTNNSSRVSYDFTSHVELLTTSFFTFTCAFIASGWRIARYRLYTFEKYAIFIVPVLFMACGTVRIFCTDINKVCVNVGKMSMIVRAIILFIILIYSSIPINKVSNELRHSPWNENSYQVYQCYQIYKRFRIVYTSFIVSLIAVFFISEYTNLIVWEELWIQYMVYHIFMFLCVINIFFNSRPIEKINISPHQNQNEITESHDNVDNYPLSPIDETALSSQLKRIWSR